MRGRVPGRSVEGVTTLLTPGQGAQAPGLLVPWLTAPGAVTAVERWSARTGLDLLGLGTTAPADVLRQTDVAQPVLTAAALLSGRTLDAPTLVCGHSVGELAALALAGVLDDDEAVALAAVRGRLMADAARLRPTGMAAVLGEVPSAEEVAAAGLELATVNAPGQVVLGGPVEALDAYAPSGRARLRRLEVAAAFHTSAMAPARDALAAHVAGLAPGEAVCPVVANADGAVLTDGRALLDRLADQLVRPVRFDLCLAALPDGPVVELAPSGVLTGLVRRARPDLAVEGVRAPVPA